MVGGPNFFGTTVFAATRQDADRFITWVVGVHEYF